MARKLLGRDRNRSLTPLPLDHLSIGGDGLRAVVTSLKGLRVLVIEDDPDALDLNARMLERAGATTLLAANMRQAIEAFRSGSPDVLLCDLDLGESVGGCDLLRSLNDVVGRSIPAIALSGTSKDQAGERARKAGFSAYLQKPTTAPALTRAIKAALKP